MTTQLSIYGELKTDVDLKKYNTYRIGGFAKYVIAPSSVSDLSNLLKYLKSESIPFFLLGNGSNVILNDETYEGVIITFNNLSAFEVNKENATVYAEAGAQLPAVVLASIDNSLRGLEFASSIPGTVGGSIYGNAGAYNSCILDYVKEITVLDKSGELHTIPHEQLTYSYRTSMFKEDKKYIIVSAKFQLEPGDKNSSLEIINDRRLRRVETQPIDYPSAGSVFRNPEGDYAGRLIEVCGLKGYQIGGAKVSEKHANFIINYQNATSKDIYELINHVKTEVKNKTNVDLVIEQEFIGWK